MRDPYASMMLHGVKTWETRNHGMFVGVEGLCLVHIGFQTMEMDAAGVFLWENGYGPDEIEAVTKPPNDMSRGQVLGVVELGGTRQLDAVERGLQDTQRKVGSEVVGKFATEVHKAWWLPRPIKRSGAPGVWRMPVDRALLPPEVLERLDSGEAARATGPTAAAVAGQAAVPARRRAAAARREAAPAPASPAGVSLDDLEDPGRLPKLVVFDLDGVCWLPEMYQTRGGPPYKLMEGGDAVVNTAGETIRLFEAVQRVWSRLHSLPGVRVAVASSSRKQKAVPLLRKLTVSPGVSMADVFEKDLFEMYYVKGQGKRPHVEELLRKTGLAPDEVLFVDDSYDNVRSVQELGVVAVHLPKGLTEWAWQGALATYRSEVGDG